jgi:LAS superfamily LD-carboxypeptidase LdcB
MRLLKAIGIVLMSVLLVASVILFLMRGEATKVSDKAAVAAAQAAAPTPEVPAQLAVTPEPTPEVTATPEPTPTEAPSPTPVPTPDPDSPAGRAAALGLPTPPDIDIDSWEYTLVNGDNSIGQYVPEQLAYLDMTVADTEIQTAYNGYRLPVDIRVAQPLIDMALGCKAAGLPVYLSSGYRSYNEQVQNFQRVCQNNGVTDGKDANGHYITMPAGCSEHQLALCCDITDVYRAIKNKDIENTETFKWLKEHCAEYGFIHRFPEGKEDITGVMYEPFHFRYVGQEVARYITDNGLVLEEFVALYRGTAAQSENTP